MRPLLKGIKFIFLTFIVTTSLSAMTDSSIDIDLMDVDIPEDSAQSVEETAMEVDIPSKKRTEFSDLPFELQYLVLRIILDGELWDFQQGSLLASRLLAGYLFVKEQHDQIEYLLSKDDVKFYLKRLICMVAEIYKRQIEIPECFFIKRFYKEQPAKEDLRELIDDLMGRFSIWGLVAARKISIGQCSTILNLPCEKIKSLEGLEDYAHLEQLRLAGNQLKNLSATIGNFTNLLTLDLSDNEIENLEGIEKLTKLVVLKLGQNKLKSLPSLEQFINLGKLNLSGNEIIDLQEGIGALTNLKRLWLFENSLRRLPESIGDLTNLEILGLSWNNLVQLPASIRKLTSLKQLDFSDNELVELPEGITNLPKLEYIDLRGNKFSQEEKEKIKGRLKNIRVVI